MAQDQNSSPFPYPMRGIGIIIIFLILAPPIQSLVALFMEHSWIGGRQLLIEITTIIEQSIEDKIMPSYALFMPPAFIAALWAAYKPALGRELTLGGAILRMIISGLFCEAIYQMIIVLSNGPFMLKAIMIGLVQWIVSGAICWFVAAKICLTKAICNVAK